MRSTAGDRFAAHFAGPLGKEPRLRMIRRVLGLGAREMAPAALGVLAFVISAFTWLGLLGVVLMWTALALLWIVNRPPALGTAVPVRLLLAAGVIAAVEDKWAATDWPFATASALLLILLLAESLVARVAAPWSAVARLRSPWPWSARLTQGGAVWLANSGLIAAFGVVWSAPWPTWPLLAVALAAAALNAAVAVDGARHWRQRRRSEM